MYGCALLPCNKSPPVGVAGPLLQPRAALVCFPVAVVGGLYGHSTLPMCLPIQHGATHSCWAPGHTPSSTTGGGVAPSAAMTPHSCGSADLLIVPASLLPLLLALQLATVTWNYDSPFLPLPPCTAPIATSMRRLWLCRYRLWNVQCQRAPPAGTAGSFFVCVACCPLRDVAASSYLLHVDVCWQQPTALAVSSPAGGPFVACLCLLQHGLACGVRLCCAAC